MKNKNLYLQFSNLQERMYSTGEDHIDLEARKILENIAWHYESGQALSVTEVMDLSHIASAATIHRKLDVLRELGLIKSIYVGDNRRTKYMAPTKLSNHYFERLSKLMHKALKTHQQSKPCN
jgi:Fe2+ or Zn2+ uptake regulation protein